MIRKFTDKEIINIYKFARKNKISIVQACRENGFSKNDYSIIRNWGKKLGLKPLLPCEISGHSERSSYLYILRVYGDKKGFYVGSSVDPHLRLEQHLSKAKLYGENGINKRDKFIFEAMNIQENFYTFEVLPKKYPAAQIADQETRLILRVKKDNPNYIMLNSFVGAPMGGYGVKLSKAEVQAVIDDYTNNKITTEKLAKKYKVGRGTINRIMQRAGATKSRAEMTVRYDDTVRQKIIEEVKNGATDNEITEKYGMSKHTLYTLKKEHGLTKNLRRITNIKAKDMVFPTLKDACDYFGSVNYRTAHRRIASLNWPVEQAFEIEPRIKTCTKKLKAVTAFGVEYKSMTHASRAFGKNPKLVARRVRSNWKLEDALTIKVGDAPLCGWNPQSKTKKRLDEVRAMGYRTLKEASIAHNIESGTVSRRLAKGFSMKDALETPLMDRWGNKINF